MRIREILFIILLASIILLIPNIIYGVTSDVTLQSIDVTNPATGTYKTGDKITIVAKYTGNVVETYEESTSISLQFGSYTTAFVKGKVNEDKIIFEYIIKDENSGALSIKSYSAALQDERGNLISNPTTLPELGGSKITVNPITWTDVSECNINTVKRQEGGMYIEIKGITELNRHSYYLFITDSKAEPTIALDTNKRVTNYTSNNIASYNIDSYMEKNGEFYVWICEEQIDNVTGEYVQKFILGKKIERPVQNKIGSRMKMYFFNDYSVSFLYEPHDNDIKRQINLKIGKVTDKSILLSIKNGETNCLNKLLSYAKTSDPMYTATVQLGRTETITAKMNLTDDEYYYVYAVLDDENGKYYPVEDVSLYQALVSESLGTNLFDYLDDQFKWNIGNDAEVTPTPTPTPTPTTDDTTMKNKLPQTGGNYIRLTIAFVVVAIAVYVYIKYRKIRDMK